MTDALEAYDQAADGGSVIGWKLGREDRAALLERFAPRYAETIADHVTLAARVAQDAALPDETAGEVVGRADDGKGVEALVVSIGGTTDRPDGSTYHITWSIGRGRKAVESNDVIRRLGWSPISPSVPVTLDPARFA